MSWNSKTVMELREEFIIYALKPEANISQLCNIFKISRKTGYKWISRYRNGSDFGNLSRKPLYSPGRTDKKTEEVIIELRKKNPTWGGRKIKAYFANRNIILPAASTISKILSRKGYINEEKRVTQYKRFEHDAPNRLWQMDYKGYFKMEQSVCHPLTILDDHSRFSICLKACKNELSLTVKESLTEVFNKYGLPERMNMDNGSPWGNSMDRQRHTQLTIWLMELGIRVSHSRPYHPQTNGKDERFHRTLKQDLILRSYFRDLNHAQKLFDDWRDFYNTQRPHEAIGNKAPISRYYPSYRSYKKVDFEYPQSHIIRKVCKGRISFKGNYITIGKAFSGKNIGLLEVTDGVFGVYFLNNKLKEFDVRHNA